MSNKDYIKRVKIIMKDLKKERTCEGWAVRELMTLTDDTKKEEHYQRFKMRQNIKNEHDHGC